MLTKAEENALKGVQTCAMKISLGALWHDAEVHGVVLLSIRRKEARLRLFCNARADPHHMLHDLIPLPVEHAIETRASRRGDLRIPPFRTVKMGKSFIISTARDIDADK